MPIDIVNDRLLSLEDVVERFPKRDGKGLSLNAVRRWIRIGCRGVVLETAPFGGKMVTSEDALRRFSAELAALKQGRTSSQTALKPYGRQRSAAEADRETAKALEALRKEGFGV